MKKRSLISLLLVLLFSISLCSCNMSAKIDENYDIAAYFREALKGNYNPEEGSTDNNNATTCHNAAVRFFTKYSLNPTDEQMARMVEIVKRAYATQLTTTKKQATALTSWWNTPCRPHF